MTAETTEMAGAGRVPLCVDLDGTLVKSDTLVDSVLVMARQRPLSLLQIPGWLGRGKAAFKEQVTRAVELDVEHLPYNRELLQYLQQEHGRGREIYLATAADAGLAQRVAAHLGIFAGVMASDGLRNLAGRNKLAAFQTRFPQGFCYIGNATPDARVLAACAEPMVANPTGGLKAGMRRRKTVPVREFSDGSSKLRAFFRAIRIHQWAKNILIFLPLMLAHAWTKAAITAGVVAFFSLSFCASATYIINDLLDLEADRRHPRKSQRAFASGDLSAIAGVAIVCVFFGGSLVLALLLPGIYTRLSGGTMALVPYRFLLWLMIYLVTTLAYSFRLKRMVMVDVIVLSALYTVRIIAGSEATGVAISQWLGAFSVFFFLSLAFVKRFAEMESLLARNAVPSNGRGYLVGDIEQLRAFGSSSAYASVFVLMLYISTLNAANLYHHPKLLWLLVPVLILWLSRMWLQASRGQLDEDPVVYAITDKKSLLLGVIVAGIVVMAL